MKKPKKTKPDQIVTPPSTVETFHGRLITDVSEINDKKNALGLFANSEITEVATPWMVTFYVVPNQFTTEVIERIYFVRAPKSAMGQACCRAVHLWDLWEKKGAGLEFSEYPMVAGRARATYIDEGDWKSYWKDAQNWPHIDMGHPDNPTAFTYFTDEAFVKEWFGHHAFDFFRGVDGEEVLPD